MDFNVLAAGDIVARNFDNVEYEIIDKFIGGDNYTYWHVVAPYGLTVMSENTLEKNFHFISMG